MEMYAVDCDLHTCWQDLSLGLFQKLSSGVGGPQALFRPVGGGYFVDNVSEGQGCRG